MRNPHNEPLGSDSSDARTSGTSGSERRCILTGQTGGRDDLVRLAISPEGLVLPDAHAKAPGRGAWLGTSRAALEEAMSSGKLKGALARAFKGAPLEIPAELPDMIEQALIKALTDRLGLEMRAGRVVLGSDRITNEARSGAIAALYHARDASDDGCRKLDQAYRVGLDAEGSGIVGDRLPLDRLALSVALGRENVVHLALADRKSAGRVAVPLGRLQTYLGAATAAKNGGQGEAIGADPEAAANM
ncbi:MAG: nucleic-acid-binding protein [Sphingomonadales bacterium 32-64-17]|nr:MAG: nucleic-acid-binding protein [Sphingomonadales bacterium 32-64-17]